MKNIQEYEEIIKAQAEKASFESEDLDFEDLESL